MSYIRVRWFHAHPREPVLLFSELDDERWETRKVEIFADGSKGYASRDAEIGGTQLGECPVPLLAEIAAAAEFLPEEITRDEFEEVWSARSVPDPPRPFR